MAKVSGTVTYTDGKIPQGDVAVVRFNPEDGSTAVIRKGASGSISPDGRFEMMTRVPGDGVYYGEYAVTFVVLRAGSPGNSVLHKYTNPRTTPFKVKIDGNKDDLKFEIESAAGATSAGGPKPSGTGAGT